MSMTTDLKRGIKAFGSREALAHELGVTSQTVWRWERGQAIPPPEQKLLRFIVEAVRRG